MLLLSFCQFATEAAITILRIDDMIKLIKDESQNDQDQSFTSAEKILILIYCRSNLHLFRINLFNLVVFCFNINVVQVDFCMLYCHYYFKKTIEGSTVSYTVFGKFCLGNCISLFPFFKKIFCPLFPPPCSVFAIC